MMVSENSMSSARLIVLEMLAQSILSISSARTVLVGIDGVDGAGKTILADELAEIISPSNRPVIRASVDGFHNPRALRYRLGRSSPQGFFRDSYNYSRLKAVLLDPLGPHGSGRFQRAVFDVETDTMLNLAVEQERPKSILLFDGIFLHRHELRAYWDFSIFLRLEWDRNHRIRHRPPEDFGPGDPRNIRYREGQNLYFRECRPWEHATVVVDNDDIQEPFIVSSRTASRKS